MGKLDDDDDDGESANEKLIKELETSDSDDATTVVIDDDDDDSGSAEPGQRQPRDQRRANRYREQREGREKAERERDDLRRQLEQQQIMLDQQRQIATLASQTPRQPQTDPLEEGIKAAQKERSRLYNSYAAIGQPTQEQYEDYQDRAYELQAKETELITQRTLRQAGVGRVDPLAASHEMDKKMAAIRYPDIFDSGPATAQRIRHVLANVNKLVAEGQPDNWQTLDTAVARSRTELHLKTAPPPRATSHAKRAMAGVGASSRTEGRREVTMTKETRKMATAMYPKLAPAEAYKKWAKTVGSVDDE
jgi:hypothetical protein